MKNRAWHTHRKLRREELPDRAQILFKAKNIPGLLNRALFITGYLTGGRISEIVKEKNLRKVKYQKEIFTDELGNKTSKIKRNANGSPIAESIVREEIRYLGITRDNVYWSFKDGRRILIISMQNRKSKKTKRKRIPIPYDREKELLDLLQEYLDTLQPDELLFPFTKKVAEDKIKKYTGFNAHFLRVLRASRLVIDHNLNQYKLMLYMGWDDPRSAEKYMRLRTGDILGGDY